MSDNVIRVTDNGILTIEYFPLAYVDLNHRFLWRVVTPIELEWGEGKVPLWGWPGALADNVEDVVKSYVVNWWNESLKQGPDPWPLKPIESVEVHRCDVVRARPLPAGG